MKLETTKISYSLELTTDQFSKVIERDDNKSTVSGCLFDILQKFGCLEVDYDGHFGTAIFFSLSIEDQDKTREVIEIIRQYIE